MKLYTQQFLIILFFIPVWMNAQVFPVQVTPQVLPPYSLKLSEYGTSDSEKLILNLLFTDITESNVQVRLKFFLENNAGLSIQSNDFVTGANPIFLDGGIPLRLTNIDLQAYFSLQNLLGISPQQYNTPLPEGLYNFCFEVYDVFSDRRISRKSCVPVYLVLNDPPFLNLPGRGEQVLLREPQNIIFQWTPRHLNATNVSYEFTLTELWDTQMDPQAAFLAGRPLYQTNTFATTLLYGPAETPLLPDKMYGWRVRALVSDGISETSVFKNNGFSEIYYFTYTGSCAEPESILAEAKNSTTEKIYWQGVDHKLYDIQYRKKTSSASGKKNSSEGNMWFNAGTQNEYTTIYNLKPGTTYEFRVGGQCIENGPYTYSQIYEFTTTLPIDDNDSTYNCGITPEILITNQESIQQLVVNETFTAGDFPVTIKEITQGNDVYTATIPEEPDEDSEENNDSIDEALPSGIQDKTFSGWGYIVVPYLNDTKIKVSFENIKINTDYQLIDGMVETDYDKNWGGLASVNEILDVFEGDNDLRNINLDYDITIDNISIADDGTIKITHPVSGAIRREPGGDDVTIMDTNPDGSRDIFHVDADGNIREGGQMAPGGPIRSQNTAGVNSNGEVTELTAKGIKVEFLEYTDYTYGFDRIPNGQETKLGKYYKQIKDTEGNPYNIINKSVGNGDEDIIRAKVTITDNSLSVHDLVIKTIHGEKVDYDVSGNEITLKLKGYYTFEHENIYATIQPKKNKTSKQTVAGVFSQWHLANKDVNVTIIPVNGASLPNSDVLGSQINKIFKQASVTFNVSVAPEMSIAKSQIGVGESGALSNYTSDQKDIINQFKSSGVTNRKSYYVFVFGDGIRPSRPSVAGFMPLKRQFGFVFSSNLSQKEEGKSSLAGTLAHELGHGAFALQHPFKKLETTTSGTDWLMDYGNGKRLSHLDWSQIHNPEFRLYLFQDGEDGASLFSALTPNWMPFTYSGSGKVVLSDEIKEPNGAVFGIIEDGKLYEWYYNNLNPSQSVYLHEGKTLEGVDVWASNDATSLQLYWNKGDCNQNEIYLTSFNYIEDFAPNGRKKLDLNNGIGEHASNIQYVGPVGCESTESCRSLVITEEIRRQIEAFETMSNSSSVTIPELVTKINSISICVLKEVGYDDIKRLSAKLMLPENFAGEEEQEKAIVKLMECIPKDKSDDFYASSLVINGNYQTLENLIQQTQNIPFSGFNEEGNSIFIMSLGTITSQLSDDNEKWNVFHKIVQQKYSSLTNRSISWSYAFSLQTILTSLLAEGESDNVPGIISVFIEMIQDNNLERELLRGYKVLVEIATLRFKNRGLYARFTIMDRISLVNENYPDREFLYEIVTPRTSFSWFSPEKKTYILRNMDIGRNDDIYVDEVALYENFKWSRYLRDERITRQSIKENPDKYLESFLSELKAHIEAGEGQNDNFWANITEVDCDNIASIVRHINLDEEVSSLKEVDKQIRLDVLENFFKCETIHDNRNGFVLTYAENSLKKLVTSFEATDTDVLDVIDNTIGIKKIYNTLRGGAFDQFALWLSMQILSSGRSVGLQLNANEYFTAFSNSSTLLQLESDIFSWERFGSIINSNTPDNPDAHNQFVISVSEDNIYYNKTIRYNQMVLVRVASRFTFQDQQFEIGDVLMVPMIQAFILSKANRDILTGKVSWLAAEVGFFALGITHLRMLYSAGRLITKGLVITDVVGSGVGIVLTSLNDNAIDPELKFKIQMLALSTSIPTLFMRPANLSRLNGHIAQVDDDIVSVGSRMTEESKNRLRNLYRAQGASVLPSYIPSDLNAAFRLDFPTPELWNNLGEDFIQAWIAYRRSTSNLTGKMCN
ncbi:fibronectin type III domain-containing protein [Aquimarina algiphila]|uniref:fibronectin type III domain-containing protein n=1 Tax=Aquimarina algiphila TaxID=2047982 RepID=UPI00232BE394|nr:fibronectin type III domain-containing protein [Aquimarina algiphila]